MRMSTLVLTGALLLMTAGCTSDQQPRDTRPAVAWTECPSQIEIAMTGKHRCGSLHVPVDDASPGQTLELDVLEVWPTDRQRTREVAVSVGFNFGEPAQEPGLMAPLADRLGVAVVSLAPRGVGAEGGIPLDCPELEGIGAEHVPQPDTQGHGSFLAAVQDCRDRLSDEGVDLSHFGIDGLVADLEALRVALDVDRWHALITYGELARVSDGYADAFPDRVRAVVKDSPPPTDRSTFSVAAKGTRSALAALFEECRAVPRCRSRYPDLEQVWENALVRAAQRPLVGSGPGGDVFVDAPKLLRATRAMLGGDGPARVTDLPRVMATAADGKVHPTLARVVADDPGYCNGYRPICTKPGFSMGAYLSQVCQEVQDQGDVVEHDSLYRQVFDGSPYVAACEIWDVPASPPRGTDAVPSLVLSGHLDSWSRPEWFDDAVVVRGATHDVVGSSPCVFEIRNPWVADPATTPDATPCESAPYPRWN